MCIRDRLYATSDSGDKGWTTAADLVVFGVETLPVIAGGEESAPVAEAAPATSAEAGADVVADATIDAATDATTDATAAATTVATRSADTAAAPAAAGQVSAQVNADGARLNVRSGPSASYRVVGKAADGEVLTATGRNGAGDWVQVERADLPDGAGWVATSFVVLDQPVEAAAGHVSSPL